jgi:predicted nucleic acid-binding protein
MTMLLDTCVLGRLANRADRDHRLMWSAVTKLHSRGERLPITPQNLIEFRNFATRPKKVNGFGFSPAVARIMAAGFERVFPLLDDVPAIYPEWRSSVDRLGVIGKHVHDARLVAVCRVYGISHILTFNVQDFGRLCLPSPAITVVHPATV